MERMLEAKRNGEEYFMYKGSKYVRKEMPMQVFTGKKNKKGERVRVLDPEGRTIVVYKKN